MGSLTCSTTVGLILFALSAFYMQQTRRSRALPKPNIKCDRHRAKLKKPFLSTPQSGPLRRNAT